MGAPDCPWPKVHPGRRLASEAAQVTLPRHTMAADGGRAPRLASAGPFARVIAGGAPRRAPRLGPVAHAKDQKLARNNR